MLLVKCCGIRGLKHSGTRYYQKIINFTTPPCCWPCSCNSVECFVHSSAHFWTWLIVYSLILRSELCSWGIWIQFRFLKNAKLDADPSSPLGKLKGVLFCPLAELSESWLHTAEFRHFNRYTHTPSGVRQHRAMSWTFSKITKRRGQEGRRWRNSRESWLRNLRELT